MFFNLECIYFHFNNIFKYIWECCIISINIQIIQCQPHVSSSQGIVSTPQDTAPVNENASSLMTSPFTQTIDEQIVIIAIIMIILHLFYSTVIKLSNVFQC